ncbi:MAG: ATP synthase F0 subunit C [Nannocystales bacterium]
MKNRIATLSAFAAAFLAPAVALAAPAAGGPNDGIFAVCMCFGVAIAAVGGGLGQGRAASAALDGICRNPGSADKVFTPLLLSLAFIESLVIFTLVVALIVSGKMG